MKKFLMILVLSILSLNTKHAFAETTYEKVMRTNTIRCGYLLWPPFFDQDIKTGKFSGMNYDYTEAIGEILNLKIEWTLEVIPGNQIEALRSGKIDAMCAGDGPIIPSTLKYMTYSTPLAYFPFFLYSRKDDTRFNQNWKSSINNPNIKIAVIDGDVSGQTARSLFPKATQIAIPQISGPTQMMSDVVTKKSDIVINDPLSMSYYLKHNPDTLKKLETNGPITVIPNTLSVLKSDNNLTFLSLINQAIENIKNSPLEKEILEPYMFVNGTVAFYPSSKSYTKP
ncbi:MAG TPA: transporter substrate-binding domain-containing protein [Alphaproteobacteria bacterium]|nr:transporter substrate-binding domain-containing protein [Alphaproteobacteria bacterium]HOO51872.1 transporter substrate-binding domain-containing protein [Alphaproteobacteria bacterium]